MCDEWSYPFLSRADDARGLESSAPLVSCGSRSATIRQHHVGSWGSVREDASLTVAFYAQRVVTRTTSGPLIAVVGPCASGKTSLVRELRSRGYNVRELAQEHSLVPDMWRRFTHAKLLVYLDVSPSVACQRRGMASPPRWWSKVPRRLWLARREADLCILTDSLTPRQILDLTLSFLGASS